MRKMRIVGVTNTHVWVQFFNPTTNEWKQDPIMKNKDFDNLMKTEYPAYYDEYLKSGTDKDAANWFYHYGETPAMIRKGDAFVYGA